MIAPPDNWRKLTDEEIIDEYAKVGIDRETAKAYLGILRGGKPFRPVD